MSEATQTEEKTPNPYNMIKPWHKADGPPTDTAEQLFFENPQQQATPEDTEAPEQEAVAPKKRTNYKKRYDDLKRHYDDRVSEFKQR